MRRVQTTEMRYESAANDRTNHSAEISGDPSKPVWNEPIDNLDRLIGYVNSEMFIQQSCKIHALMLDHEFWLLAQKPILSDENYCDLSTLEIFLPTVLSTDEKFIILVDLRNMPPETLTDPVGPSLSDLKIAHRLSSSLKLFGIILLDHVIFQHNTIYSFRRYGLLG